jgi:hypothetical protein
MSGVAALACLAYPGAEFPNSTFEAAAFVVEVLKDRSTEAECFSDPTNERPPSVVSSRIIGGARFKVGFYAGVGIGNANDSHYYRTFHEKRCYQLSINVDEQNGTGYDPWGDTEGIWR